MVQGQVSVIDADGHLVESIPELAEFMDPDIRQVAVAPLRNRQGVFPALDGAHYPRGNSRRLAGRPYVAASEHRRGSGEDCLAFVERAEITQTALYPSEGLSVGQIQVDEYAIRLCRAYNDYVAQRYQSLSDRLHPVALIPMQVPAAAAQELRRAVKELGLVGAMLPSRGLPLDLGHEYYWPVYQEAASLGCALGVHGGSYNAMGIDTFPAAAHVVHHSVPLAYAMLSFILRGVLDRFPDLHVSFLEGGCAWLVLLLDRMRRDERLVTGAEIQRTFNQYLTSGQILIGCEGNDPSLPYLVKQVGVEPFAYSSDYPHEVDLEAARQMIEETLEDASLLQDEKEAILGGNARAFYRL